MVRVLQTEPVHAGALDAVLLVVGALARLIASLVLDALLAVEGLMDVVADTFASGHNIYLRGFGTFKVRTTKPKKARNISAGTTIVVPPRKSVKFIPCEDLKKRLRGNE